MAEVLSQNQIDSLLNSMLDNIGDEKPEAKIETQEEIKYRKYDFYSPKKFTKDKLKLINSIYENYARIISSQVNSLFRVNSVIEVIAVEEQRYSEFNNALDDKDIISIVGAKLPDGSKGTPIVVHTTIPLVLSMVDRMLGGTGEEIDIGDSYKYTDVEIALYENIIKNFISVMADSWQGYLELEFDFSKLETNPSLFHSISNDEIVVIVGIKVSFRKTSGLISICVPASLLISIFEAYDLQSMPEEGLSEKENNQEEIFSNIINSNLEVVARIGEGLISIEDVYNLKPGDVINFNKPKDSEVYLYIEDNIWFKGKMGVNNKNKAVQISELCEQW